MELVQLDEPANAQHASSRMRQRRPSHRNLRRLVLLLAQNLLGDCLHRILGLQKWGLQAVCLGTTRFHTHRTKLALLKTHLRRRSQGARGAKHPQLQHARISVRRQPKANTLPQSAPSSRLRRPSRSPGRLYARGRSILSVHRTPRPAAEQRVASQLTKNTKRGRRNMYGDQRVSIIVLASGQSRGAEYPRRGLACTLQ